MVLLPNTDPCPNPELCPNAGAVLCPNSPEPVLLAVLALLVPKEKELALLAVEAPKRPPPVVALLELAPNADWPKEKPLADPVLLAGWPKPLAWPNTGLPKLAPVDAPNPDEPNPVDTGAAGAAAAVGAEGAEVAGGAAGCPNTVLAAVVVAPATVGVEVVAAAGLTVLITGVTSMVLLSVVAGAGWVKMEPGLSELGTWNAGGATWATGATAGVAAAEVGTGAAVVVVVLSGVASTVGAALASGGGVASAGAVREEGGSGVAEVGAGGGVGAGAVSVAAVVPVVEASSAGSGATRGLALSTAGSAAGSFSGGGVGSEGCVGAFGSSEESEGAERRLLKDVGKAEVIELGWGTEKAGLGVDSGGLNKLPVATPFDKSATAASSADFWRPAAKLNCAATLPIPSPVSPKVNEAAAGLMDESLASSPGPTRSPEKLPRVSPPTVFGGCGSILRAGVVEVGLSAEVFGGSVGDAVPRARENESSPGWLNIIFPFPPKENLLMSFTGQKNKNIQIR